MTLRAYLTLMIMATIICGVVFGVIITLINPLSTNWLGFLLFYASAGLTVMGVASILGFIVRFGILRKHLAVHAVIISFRQAFLVAFLTVLAMLLLAQHLFSWLNVLFLVIGFSVLEFFLLSLSSGDDR